MSLLGMVGPFAVDTYLPAFSGMGRSLGATPVQMQQTLSAYLFGFAFMSLFHGAISDSFGRRPVVLWGVAVFTLASVGCALSQNIGQLIFFASGRVCRPVSASWCRAVLSEFCKDPSLPAGTRHLHDIPRFGSWQ